jgi:hypothetical protein
MKSRFLFWSWVVLWGVSGTGVQAAPAVTSPISMLSVVSTAPTPVPTAGGTPVPANVSPPSDRGLAEQLNRILQRRPVRLYLKLVADPGFSSGLEELSKNADWLKLLYAQLGLLLAIGLIRAWRLSKTTLWYWHLWTRTWTRGLFWGLSLVVLPGVILGEPFFRILRGIWDVAIDAVKGY